MAQHKGLTTEHVVEVFLRVGTVAETARQLDVARSTVQGHLKKAGIKKPVAAGLKTGLPTQTAKLPEEGQVKRYLLTCAQNNTWVNKGVWENLQALAEHYDAEIKVARFSYNLQGFQPAKPGAMDTDSMWYDPVLAAHTDDRRIELLFENETSARVFITEFQLFLLERTF